MKNRGGFGLGQDPSDFLGIADVGKPKLQVLGVAQVAAESKQGSLVVVKRDYLLSASVNETSDKGRPDRASRARDEHGAAAELGVAGIGRNGSERPTEEQCWVELGA